MESTASKFNINIVREVFILGDDHHIAFIRKLLKGIHYLYPRIGTDVTNHRDDMHFLLAVADFSHVTRIQKMVQALSSLRQPLTHKLIYAVNPQVPDQEHLLLAQELGARYVFFGENRNDALKDYLRRVCLDEYKSGKCLISLTEELEDARLSHDRQNVEKVIEKIRALEHDSEDKTRLLAEAYMMINDLRRAEGQLKKLLLINDQNLWAANTLGKLYIRGGRASEGIGLLRHLSKYHDLNSERLLTLGNAEMLAGNVDGARAAFQKGDSLTGGGDERFRKGLAMIEMAGKNFAGALDLIPAAHFSDDILAFLNLKGIMAVKSGQMDDAVLYYEQALRGAGSDKLLQAKLKFNLGLAFVKRGELEKARDSFYDSCVLGGARFERARGPLDVVKNILQGGGRKPRDPNPLAGEDLEWETLY